MGVLFVSGIVDGFTQWILEEPPLFSRHRNIHAGVLVTLRHFNIYKINKCVVCVSSLPNFFLHRQFISRVT